MKPYQFLLGQRVKGPSFSGEVVAVQGPYSVTVRVDATGRLLTTTTTDLELTGVPRTRTLD